MKKNLRFLLIVGTLLTSGVTIAQINPADSSRINSSFERFKQQAHDDFNQFKSQAEEDFNQFLAEAWTEYQCFLGDNGVFTNPKPSVIPTIKTNSGKTSTQQPPAFQVQSIPNPTTTEPNEATRREPNMEAIRFYGRTLRFHLPTTLKVTANGTKERDVAAYYKTLSSMPETKQLHKELTATVNRLGLNPWGYFLLLRTLAEKTFSSMNDRVLFCFAILHSNGFMARVGRGQQSKQLMLLLAIDNSKEVYSLPFFRINKVKYYAVYGGNLGEDAYSYNEKADDSRLRQVGLDFKNALNVNSCDKLRTMHLNRANIDLSIPFSTANMRYYDDVPLTVFPVYAKGAVNPEAKKAIDTTINTLLQHYSKPQLVELMLDFVQSTFAYQIDEAQFGHEKYFYPEEVIGYPYSDCEDRCALFAWLVRSFTDYEVIGILYPDHLATAVCFGDDHTYTGKSFVHEGKTFILCDPTCPNAPIGKGMAAYDNANYSIVGLR